VSVRTVLREPLLHFLLIGLALFAVYGRASPGDDDRRILVTQGQFDDMAREYQSAFKRPPTRAEMDGLIATYVRDEIIYREGLAMGLDQDDAVIKRRIRQKYELIAEEEQRADPTDADLAAYLKANSAKFVRPAVVSFEQLFFDPATISPEAVTAVKAELVKGADPARFGQPSMLPARVAGHSLVLVERDFGDSFARQLAAAPVGRWVGPFLSGLGVHLVRVTARSAPIVPALQDVRAAVAREWESDQRRRSSDANYRKARAQYDVVVEARRP
jgi:peptidyl-prolyl cis-trans isomerase C